MVITNLRIDINRPVNVVFAFLMNLSNYPLWQSSLIEAHASAGMTQGSTIKLEFMGLGRQFSMNAVVTENNNRNTFTVVARQGPITFESAYHLQAQNFGTRLEVLTKVEIGTVFRLAEGAVQSISDAKFEADLKSLKILLESSPSIVAAS